MSLLLTICLSLPGACQNTYVDQLEALGLSEAQLADPVERWRPLVASVFPDAEVETGLTSSGKMRRSPRSARPVWTRRR